MKYSSNTIHRTCNVEVIVEVWIRLNNDLDDVYAVCL